MKVLIFFACLVSLGLTNALSLLPDRTIGPIGPIEPFPTDPVRPACGPVCFRFCPNGNVLDARGCPICKCKGDNPVCRKYACKCPFGTIWLTDPKGCRRCSCKPKHNPVCRKYACKCPYGTIFFTDPKGCRRCNCKQKQTCTNNGVTYSDGQTFKKDCNTCTCRNGFPVCTEKACLPARPICPLRKCRPCKNGYVYKNSCRTCQCKPVRPCPSIRCRRKCPLFMFRKDSKGCQTCQCRFPFIFRRRPESEVRPELP